MLMDNMLKNILEDISHYVLSTEYSSLEHEYMLRLSFLYSLQLKNLLEINCDTRLHIFVEEVKKFEKKEIKSTTLYLDDFGQITPEIALQVFSILSNQLAKNRIQGNLFQHLAYLTEELYIGFITGNSLRESDKNNNELLISETLLDFDFASCKSDNTSFRLLHYNNSI